MGGSGDPFAFLRRLTVSERDQNATNLTQALHQFDNLMPSGINAIVQIITAFALSNMIA
jgi:hypothetical protein